MAEITKDDVVAVFKVIIAVAHTIRELGEVPAGHLYVRLQEKLPSITMDNFQTMMTKLEDARLISYNNHHLITWVGPKDDKKA